jgi:hypothetical protein
VNLLVLTNFWSESLSVIVTTNNLHKHNSFSRQVDK